MLTAIWLVVAILGVAGLIVLAILNYQPDAWLAANPDKTFSNYIAVEYSIQLVSVFGIFSLIVGAPVIFPLIKWTFLKIWKGVDVSIKDVAIYTLTGEKCEYYIYDTGTLALSKAVVIFLKIIASIFAFAALIFVSIFLMFVNIVAAIVALCRKD